MRIAHVTDCYLPRLGGIELHVRDLASAQRRDGNDAHVLTVTPGTGLVDDPSWVVRVRNTDAAVPRQLGLARQIADRLAAADVVHAHVSVISPFAFGAARLAASMGVPTLVTVHSLWSHLGVLPSVGCAVAGLRGWPVQWSAVSAQAAEPVRRALGPHAPVIVLPNALDFSEWTITARTPTVPTIVSVMRLAPTKRPLPLARMLRKVRAELPASRPLRAVIVGDGTQRGALERYLARHQLGWVELPGRLARPEIRDLFGRSSVYVAPAHRESFGIAALEARATGLPVVASTHGGVGTFVTSGVDGLLTDDDAGTVAALVRLLTEPGLADNLRASRLPAAFGWEAACASARRAY
ncbi:MAG: glycosyl transferase, group 1, partial [Nocardioides sp.]|nr:glycosyl transferase, group 1 [Nocardioides sp.]